ncbi:MAG: metallophosphoesterase family protein [Crenarchaeota archaeon]|nr:metallophosphoesterase family protein [Thermoproteota archaeon]MCR8489063.1 metallophosphoesterase family protein [Thermoproteota archaeon]
MIMLAILSTILIILVVYLLWNFPWLTGYFEPIIYTRKLSGSKVAVFSDTHIERGSLPTSLTEFILKEKFDLLVAAGDLIEYGHKRIRVNDLKRKLAEIFSQVIQCPSIKEIFYITSMSSHDPKIGKILELMINGKKVTVVPGVLILDDSVKYYITHGDYASRNGSIARILNRIFDLWTEKRLRKALKMSSEAWLICGHTHISRVSTELRIVNTGSWHRKALAKPEFTLAVIDTGKNIVVLEKLAITPAR